MCVSCNHFILHLIVPNIIHIKPSSSELTTYLKYTISEISFSELTIYTCNTCTCTSSPIIPEISTSIYPLFQTQQYRDNMKAVNKTLARRYRLSNRRLTIVIVVLSVLVVVALVVAVVVLTNKP